MFKRLHALGRNLARMGRLMVGVPDYQTYLARRRHFSAQAPVMTEAEFVRYCNQRRLGGRRPGGCC
jgi:uncharacterized short protein YbdD (DUF466 family)